MSDKQKLTINPYLTFGGNCREAMEFYHSVLGGNLDIRPFEGAPMEIPDDYKHKVMHARLNFSGGVNMASDSMPGQAIDQGNAMHLSLNPNDVVEAERLFNDLSVGGKVTMPFQQTFWGAKFGSFIDKFGLIWMINCELPASE